MCKILQAVLLNGCCVFMRVKSHACRIGHMRSTAGGWREASSLHIRVQLSLKVQRPLPPIPCFLCVSSTLASPLSLLYSHLLPCPSLFSRLSLLLTAMQIQGLLCVPSPALPPVLLSFLAVPPWHELQMTLIQPPRSARES